MSTPETKNRILDTAERVFARDGFRAGVRAITAEADVNVAAVNYHFGTKEGLIRAVFERRLAPVNRERLERLDALEAAGTPGLEDVLGAFIGPVADMHARDHAPDFLRLVGRVLSHAGEDIESLLIEQFDEVRRRFVPAFCAAEPDMDPAAAAWGLHLLIGAMAHGLLHGRRLQVLLEDAAAPAEHVEDDLCARLIAFAAGGMRGLARARMENRP